MHHLLGAVVRRGLDVHASFQSDKGDRPAVQVPVWVVLTSLFTAVAFIITIVTVDYTYGQLITTLAMVESSTTPVVYEEVSVEDPDLPLQDNKTKQPSPSEPASGPAPKVVPDHPPLAQTPIAPAPVTASMRGTILHLRRQAGYFSRFRGFSLHIIYILSYVMLSSVTIRIFHAVLRSTALSTVCGTITAEALLAGLHMTWTHIVISGPSSKPWFRRMGGFASWKQVIVPSGLVGIVQNVAGGLPMFLMRGFGKADIERSPSWALSKLFGLLVLTFVLTYTVVIPMTAVLRRVEASLLPHTEETVVPFDRTFGGRLLQIPGEAPRAISMRQAWKSLDSSSRYRIAKTYVKVIALELFVMTLFFVAMLLPIFLF